MIDPLAFAVQIARRIVDGLAPGEALPDVADLFLKRDGSPRLDLAMLYPPFHARVRVALARSRARGHDYYVTCGHRAYDEQAKRRAAYVAGTGTLAAPAGLSAHQYGGAVDCAPDGDAAAAGLQADYHERAYAVLAEEAARVGLVWGGTFSHPDTPHVQIPRFVSGKQLAELRGVYERASGDDVARVRAVWAYLDALPLFKEIA